jgi:chaperonin cofactor prefoldin
MERIVHVEEELKALREIQIAQFEAMEKRFEVLQREMDKRFEALQREMDKRFEAMEVRFEAIDKRFEAIEKRLNFMQWFIGIGFTIVSILIALFSFVGK